MQVFIKKGCKTVKKDAKISKEAEFDPKNDAKKVQKMQNLIKTQKSSKMIQNY